MTILIAGEPWEAVRLPDEWQWPGWSVWRVGRAIVYQREAR